MVITSGLDIGTDSFDTNLMSEVRELASENQVVKARLGDNPFQPGCLMGMISRLEEILKRECVDTNEIISLSVDLSPYSKKLELSSFKATISTLRHTLSLFLLAERVMSRGRRVLIIESCDFLGNQLLPDLDLMYEYNEETIAVDVTGDISLRENTIKRWTPKEKEDKYKKLGLIPNCTSTLVMSFGVNPECYNLKNIEFNVFRESAREKDFQFVDETIDAFKGMTWLQAKECLFSFSSKLRDLQGVLHSDQIKRAGVYTSLSDYESMKDVIHCNNYETAHKYETFRDNLRNSLLKSRNKTALASDYFSLGHYDRIASCNTRWHIPFPEIPRGITESSPFLRLKESLIGTIPDPLSWGISQLEDVDSVKLSSYPYCHPLQGLFLQTSVHRVVKKGVKLNMYKLRCPSVIDLFQSMSKMNSSERTGQSLSSLEDMYTEYKDYALSTGTGSQLSDDINLMIDDVLPESQISAVARKIMGDAFQEYSRSKLFSLLSISQEIVRAMTTGPRLRQRLKSKSGGVKSGCITMALQNISDRKGVVSFNVGPLTFGDTKDVTYMLHGDLISTTCAFQKSHYRTITSPLSMSPSMLDWFSTAAHKSISWCMLQYEQCLASMPKMRHDIIKECVIPISLCFLNSNTFSQIADLLRYVFINGMGHTTGVSPLFEKMSWYEPKTHIEKLYVLRMLKMSDCLSIHKALGSTESLTVTSGVKLKEQGVLNMTVHISGWKIAMPDESRYYLSQQHTFNSFYNSRALCMQRYQKLMSEALVMNKQLDARETYVQIKRACYTHEGRFNVIGRAWSPAELAIDLLNFKYDNSLAQPFSPCPRTNYLAILSSLNKISDHKDKTVGDTISRVYNVQDVHRKLLLSKVINNRGAVRDSGETGLVVSRVEMVVDEKGKQKKKVTTQNSKCYLTQLNMMTKFIQGKKPPRTQPHNSSFKCDKDPDIDLIELERIIDLPDNMSSLLCWAAHNHAACISKMVHKDQLGSREIAVLNAYARLMCRYVEDIARHIRDKNFSRGDKANLIENPDKDDIVLKAKRRSDLLKDQNKHVYYDSADCSTWGPSMQPYFMYQNLAARCDDDTRRVLRNCLTLFSNKVFKIPDALYWYSKESKRESSSMVDNVCSRIKSMNSEVGIYEKQILFLEESMHQGILGCSSSLMGSDAHNLSDFVLTDMYRDCGFMSETFTTSDDYARIMSWDRDTKGVFDMMKSNLSVHTFIMKLMGIKRNKQKSTMSDSYFEFNSTFMTSMGEIRPDVKSRIAYIDYCHSPDSYDSSIRSISQTSEYLRQEGSVIGSCWILLLNNHLSMIQSQSRSLWKQLGTGIYKVPLELGGLPLIDPLLHSVGHSHLGILNNYGGYENIAKSFNVMNDCAPYTATLSVNERNMPSLTRSGVVHLCSKTSQTKRRFKEFLMKLPHESFASAYMYSKTPQVMLALMACSQREKDTAGSEGSFSKLMVTQTPHNAILYKVSSGLIGTLLGKDKVSRADLHGVALKFATAEQFDYPYYESGINYKVIEKDYLEYKQVMENLIFESLTSVPRLGHYHVARKMFAEGSYIQDRLREFEETNMPVAFGGHNEIHPWDFLEAKMSYTNFLRNMSTRRQAFRMCLRKKDRYTKTFTELLLASNFMGGMRMSFKYQGGLLPKVPVDATLTSILEPLSNLTPSRTGPTINLLSPGLPALMRLGGVGRLDITEFMNLLIGDSRYYSNSDTLEAIVIDSLYRGGFGDKLVIRPSNLSVQFKEDRHRGSNNAVCSTLNVVSDEGLSGREIRLKFADGKWHHYFWGTRTPVTAPNDEEDDICHCYNVHEHDVLEVKIAAIYGFLAVVTKNDLPLQILTRNVADVKKLRLFSRDPLRRNHWLIDKLRTVQATMMPQTFVDYMSEPKARDIEPRELVQAEEDVNDDLMSDDDIWGDSVSSKASKHSEEASESPRSEEKYSAPISEQSSIRQPMGDLISLGTVKFREMTYREFSRYKPKLSRDMSFGYELKLPTTMISTNFQDGDETAIEKLFDATSKLNPIDRLWIEDYLCQSFLSDEGIREEVESSGYVERSRLNFGFEEDDEFNVL